MSIVNIVISEGRAIIAADTAAGLMEGGEHLLQENDRYTRHSCKTVALPHIDVALVTRGDGFLTSVACLNIQTACPLDYDHVETLMPAVLDHAYFHSMEQRKSYCGLEEFPGAEMTLVGWSPAQGRFAAVQWVRRPNDEAFTQSSVEDAFLMPFGQEADVPKTPQEMEVLMRRQVAWVRQKHPQLPCGGRLILTELRRGEICQRTIADLG